MSTNTNLGRLERVDLRAVWESEAGDFTPWLAQEENIALLSDAIAIDLEVEAEEKNVGPFRADILCKDTASDEWVLIENQLEKTDHVHLGQLMTYASGLHAVTIVWIAYRFTEEHRAALDWLNEITNEEFNFFGLEIEVWRIGDSAMAPKFNIVSKPNDWTRSISGAASRLKVGELSETKRTHLEFWTQFRELMEERGGVVRPTKPRPQHWQNFSIGRSDVHLSLVANTRDNRIGIKLYIDGDDAKIHFHILSQQRDRFEQSLGQLEWIENPEKKSSQITQYRTECDPSNKADWQSQHEWLFDRLQAFHEAFYQPVKRLNADDYESVEDEMDQP